MEDEEEEVEGVDGAPSLLCPLLGPLATTKPLRFLSQAGLTEARAAGAGNQASAGALRGGERGNSGRFLEADLRGRRPKMWAERKTGAREVGRQ